ncbi:MAG: S-layer homology domain-containing protein [Acidobacteriota bacterium]|jgi:hypothetical protein|nr:S-layer homology domain-containing protein [Acidobacteriota bacterium]
MYRRKFIGAAGAGAFALASGVASSVSSMSSASRFTDVNAADQFYDAVNFVTERGLIDGAGNGFQPDAGVSRAAVVTALYRLDGKPEVVYEKVFSDVPEGQWYSSAVIWADKAGLTGEFTSGGIFGPNDNVSREQLAAMIFNYADIKLPETADLAGYADAGRISPWAETAIGWGILRGVISGATATTLAPGGAITRAQFAASLQRFVNLREDPRNIWVLNPVPGRTPVAAVPLASRVEGGWEGKTLVVLANYNANTAEIAAEVEKLLPESAKLFWIGDMTVIAGQTVNPSRPPSDKWAIMRYMQEFQPALREGRLKPDAIISGTGF